MGTDDFERRLGRLERLFESVAEAARRREEDFGSVRAQANRVPDLQEEIRELRRQLVETQREAERLARQLGREPEATVTEVTSEKVGPVAPVLQAPSADQIRVWVNDEVAAALRELDIGELLARTHPGIGRGAESLAQALRRLGIEVEPETLVSAILDVTWERIDLDQIYDAVAGQLKELIPRRIRRPY